MRLAQTFADQSVIALENVRILAALQSTDNDEQRFLKKGGER
ncbi:hypothetical protein [Hwanghaeella grinnelliae]|nr:hypothetical protein [Hwanghaeella grinnelliae]